MKPEGVDLQELARRRQAQRQLQEEQKAAESQKQAVEDFKRFDKAMTRAFKGIYSRNLRMKNIMYKIKLAERAGLIPADD